MANDIYFIYFIRHKYVNHLYKTALYIWCEKRWSIHIESLTGNQSGVTKEYKPVSLAVWYRDIRLKML